MRIVSSHWSLVAGRTKALIIIVLLLACYLLPTATFAQQGIEVTNVFEVKGENIQDGDIVSTTSDGVSLSTRPYDPRVFGIVQNNPLIVYRRVDNQGVPVVRQGVAKVNVTNFNGPIKVGDYIATSDVPGKGQRAGISGYVLGIALENFDGANGEKVKATDSNTKEEKEVTLGKIEIAVKIEYAEITGSRSLGRAFDYLNGAFFKNVQDPEQFTQVVRYIAAALAVIIAFAVAFFTFSRSLPKAMEAIGRNPLAANTIRVSIILNIVFTILSALVGIIAAIVIVKL